MKNLAYFIKLIFGGKIKSEVTNIGFIEEGLEDKGFSEFFTQEIKPDILKLEAIRIKNLKSLLFRSRLVLISWIALGIFVFSFISSPDFHNLTSKTQGEFFKIITLVASFPVIWASLIFSKFKLKIKSDLFKNIFKFFGNFKYNPEGNKIFEIYDQFNILPRYDQRVSRTEDSIVGSHKDVNLYFEEICLQVKSGKSTKTTFSGAVILLSFHKNFKGRTIVKKELGKIANFSRKKISNNLRGLQRVELEDPEFEKMFEVYSEDQIEARYLLTTSFMERLKKLSNFFDSEKTEISFHENKLFLTFSDSEDLFEPRSIFEEINLVKECKTVITQMNLIFDIIDILQLDKKTGL